MHEKYYQFVPPVGILRDHKIDSEYIDSAFHIANLIQQSVDITSATRIADIGCAAGRLSLPFLHTEYIGLDLRAKSIDWATNTITKAYPKVKFQHFNCQNEFYNPTGIPLIKLPLPDNYFDLVIFHSVFTHISFVEAQHFLSETKRILKPGGAVHLTVFLWDDAAKQAFIEGRCSHDFSEQKDRYRVEHHKKASALEATDFYHELIKQKLHISFEKLNEWRYNVDMPQAQDRFILRKGPEDSCTE